MSGRLPAPTYLCRLALLALFATVSVAVAAPTAQDYINGFVLYVRWPDDAHIRSWQVCTSATANDIDAGYAARQVRDRPFVVRHLKNGEALDGCQILDLTGTDTAAVAALLKAAQARQGLLTVGSGRDFCSAGGMICLLPQEPRGGFEVNLSAIKSSQLAINARLLMMARQGASEGAPP